MQSAQSLIELVQGDSDSFSFFVPGIPASQGSKNAIPRICWKGGKPKAIVSLMEQDKKLPEWRASVKAIALAFRPQQWNTEEAYIVDIIFYMPRPKDHFTGKGEKSSKHKFFHCVAPDLDKMQRAVGDALTGVAYRDDSQAVASTTAKIYAHTTGTGALVTVSRIPEGAGATLAFLLA